MARRNFKPGTLQAPLPAVLVSVGDMEESNILTIAWTGILSSDPPRTYISVRPSRHSHKILTEKREFVINLTTEKLALATDYAGIYTGAKVDKFKKCNLTKQESAVVSAPTVAESPIALECKVFDIIHSGTHDIFMADIVNVSCDEELLDKNGKICFDRAKLIAYSHGEYYALGRKIGRFGYSTDKKKKAALASSAKLQKSAKGGVKKK
ncbi:MAG: flavin reductase family protein [Ruminococcaceae bacterium]|nr:flavin reductase family protein [Oscillospiraceae bacterium]